MIPLSLQPYLSTQHYDYYTPIDHAVWRYIMRQNIAFLKEVAHPAYVKGMDAYGINPESIPNVDEMNACLQKAGWGAATIDGLIPGVAFFDFQGSGILPIATAIRRIENIAYTPAPDIVHEAAGHAPILFDTKYASYIRLIGTIGAKAFATKEEHALFDAIRKLTIIAENKNSTPKEIEAAESLVSVRQQAITKLSEAEQISRLFWWTVEYGLIGEIDNPKIYGAGLLSSVGESRHCLTSAVKKIPYTIDSCIHTTYDVTKMQPQLFVCKSFDELIHGILTFSETMAFKTGGPAGLEKALQSESLATIEFNSGLQISSVIEEIFKDENGNPIFLKCTGPTSLSIGNVQLPHHSKDVHHHGFSTPIGPLENDICLEFCDEESLQQLGLTLQNHVHLSFKSGIFLTGTVTNLIKNDETIALISFDNCTITYKDTVLFDPSWGIFDMPVGSHIISVYPGVADYEAYFGIQHAIEQTPPPPPPLTRLEEQYGIIRQIRHTKNEPIEDKERKIKEVLTVLTEYPDEWLIRLEMLEILDDYNIDISLQDEIVSELLHLSKNETLAPLISNGLQLLKNMKGDSM